MKHRVALNRKAYCTKNMVFAMLILAVCLFVFPMSALADCSGLVNGATGTIDLGGVSCSLDSDITITETATITNGKITSAADDVLTVDGGKLTLGSGLTVECTSSVIWAKNNAEVIIDGATITGKSGGEKSYPTVFTEGNSTITINSGTVNSEVNTTLSVSNSTVNINGGTVSNNIENPAYCTAYSKNGGKIILDGGTVKSEYGGALAATKDSTIEVKSGTVISAQRQYAVIAHEGNAIALISGGTVNGAVGAGSSNPGDNNTLTISGGEINGTVYQTKGTVSITGGTFSPKPNESYVDFRYETVKNDDNTYSIKMAVLVKPEAANKTYGNADPSFEFSLYSRSGTSLTNLIETKGALSREKIDAEDGNNVGTYAFSMGTLELAERHQAGYVLILDADEDAVFTINPLEAQVTWGNNIFTYDGAEHAPEAIVSNLIEGDNCVVTIEGAQTDAIPGYMVYYATAAALTGEDSSNYVLPDPAPTKRFRINPAELKLTWVEPFEFEYNGKPQHPSFTLTGCVGSDAADSEGTCTVAFIETNIVREGNTAAGSYRTQVYLSEEQKNYKLSYTDTDYTINAKKIEVDWVDGVDEETGEILLEYNGEFQSPEVKLPENSLVDGDTCTLKFKERADQREVKLKNVSSGRMKAEVTFVEDDCNQNYSITNPMAIFRISPKDLTLDYTYDPDVEPLVYNGEEQHPDFTLTGCVGDDAEDSEGTCTDEFIDEYITTFGEISAGTYTTNAHLADYQENYKLNEKSIGYRISKKPITIIWEGNAEKQALIQKEYNGARQYLTAAIKDGNIVGEDNCILTVSHPARNVSDGTVTARADFSKKSGTYQYCLDDYEITDENRYQDFSITPLTAVIDWDQTTTSFDYDGNEHVPTAYVNNRVEGDECVVTVSGAQEKIGEHTATAVELSNPNYALPEDENYRKTSFVINPAEVELIWSNEGPFTYINKTAQAPTAQYKDVDDIFVDAVITLKDADGNEINEAVDAGDYIAIASIDDPNYTFANPDDVSKPFTITKAKVTVVPTEPLSKPFGVVDQTPFNYEIRNVKGTTDVRTTIEQPGSYLTRDYTIEDKAGCFYEFIIDNIKLKPQYDKNYELVLGNPKYFKIEDGKSGEIVLPTAKDDLTYNGTAQELFNAGTAEHGIFMYSADGEEWSSDMPEQTNAGDYRYYFYIKGDENYEDKYAADGTPFTIDGNIRPAKLTVTPKSDQKKTYGDPDPDVFFYDVSGKVNDEEPVFTGALKRQKGEKGENVGTYFIRKGDLKLDPDVEVNKNYDPELGWTNGVLFTITPQTAVINWDQTTTSYTYDGIEHVPTAYVNNLVEGDKCEVNVNGAQMKIGEHTATAVELSNPNYALPEDENYRNTSFVINPAKVTVTADNKSKIYGTEDPKLTATVTGLKGSDTEDVITYTLTREDNENVGEYAITPAGDKDQGNYEVSFEPGTFTINPAKVTVKVTGRNVEAVYDGEQHSTVYDMKKISDESGKYDLNDVQFVGTAWRVDKVDVGEYDLILSTGDFKNNNKNYDVDFQVSNGKLTITEAYVTVTVTGRIVIADYDGEVHSTVYDMKVTSDETGKYNLDDVKFVGTAWRVDKTDADEYDLTLSERDFDNTNKNFDVTFQVTSGKLTINQAKVTVTADDKTKVYGADDPKLTAKVEGLKGGDGEDVITYTLTRADGEEVGEYVITPAGNESQGNYKVTYKPGTLTIGQANVTVKVTGRNVEAVYDGKVHTTVYDMAVTSDESGKYNLDDVRITGAAWRIDKTDAGEYELKLMPSNFSNVNDNFNVKFETENGNLTIKPLLAEIEWSDLQKFYNGQKQYPIATVKNKIGEDVCDVTVEAKDGKTPVSAGTYTAVAVGLSNTNYTLDPDALPSTDYQIFAKLAEVEWSEPEKVYNGEAQLPTATIKASDLVAGDTCTVVVEIEGGKAVDAGDYTAKASSFEEEFCQQNYSLSGEKLKTPFTITPKTVDLTWTPETDPILFSYDGQPHRPEASYTNVKDETVVVKDEEITITPGGQAVNFGEYTATAKSADKNYVFSEGTASKVFRIVAKVIKVVPNKDQRMIYGTPDEELNLTYTLRDEAGNTVSEPELEGKLGHEGTNIGEYDFKMGSLALKSEDKDNYTLTLDTSVKFTIEAKPVSVTWGNTELTYNGEKQVPVAYVPDEEIEKDDNVKVVYSDDSYQTDAGEGYTAKVTGLDNENYTLKDGPVVTTTFSIAKANFEPGEDFTPPDDIEGLSYTGQPQNLITGGTGDCVNKGICTILYEITDFQSEMITKEISSKIPQGTDAGTYTISWMIEGDKNHNDYPGGTIMVRLAPTALSNANIIITPGTSFVYDHTQKSVEYTVVGSDGSTPLTKGVDYTVVKEETSAFAVGTYEIVINGLGGYTGTNVRKTWEIIDNETIKPFEFYRLNGFWDHETNCPAFGCGQQLPATGFPTRFRMPLSVRPDGLKYQDLGMRLQIPALAVNVDLVGVPKLGNDWAIEWLGADAGILSGTSEPGRGYTMVAGHNHLNDSEMGPFLNLGSLKEYDTIYISLENGMNLPFSVYANELMRPDDYEAIAKIAAEDPHSIVLVTCENETAAGGYMNRRVVFAKPF